MVCLQTTGIKKEEGGGGSLPDGSGHERKGNEGQRGNIVGDEHASEKHSPTSTSVAKKGAVGTEQCPRQSIKKPCRLSRSHDRHQETNRQRAQVDVAEILRIRRNKKKTENNGLTPAAAVRTVSC